ncbi:hypothetical protein EVAR_71224_1 [Eumeta japonica]|uniref:Uncharacterized protein n=1 Tax=Eumeta variegata TaxID=151549 RepID=A0A4C1T5F6_EUMVA|nr:hypothetical protein EVAR_71224_1 [Eumeta japonica]
MPRASYPEQSMGQGIVRENFNEQTPEGNTSLGLSPHCTYCCKRGNALTRTARAPAPRVREAAAGTKLALEGEIRLRLGGASLTPLPRPPTARAAGAPLRAPSPEYPILNFRAGAQMSHRSQRTMSYVYLCCIFKNTILARLLPLDIRVREAARLYEVKRGRELGDVCADRELERPVDFRDLPHPAHTPEFGFESVEDLNPSTVDRLAIVGPHRR